MATLAEQQLEAALKDRHTRIAEGLDRARDASRQLGAPIGDRLVEHVDSLARALTVIEQTARVTGVAMFDARRFVPTAPDPKASATMEVTLAARAQAAEKIRVEAERVATDAAASLAAARAAAAGVAARAGYRDGAGKVDLAESLARGELEKEVRLRGAKHLLQVYELALRGDPALALRLEAVGATFISGFLKNPTKELALRGVPSRDADSELRAAQALNRMFESARADRRPRELDAFEVLVDGPLRVLWTEIFAGKAQSLSLPEWQKFSSGELPDLLSREAVWKDWWRRAADALVPGVGEQLHAPAVQAS